MTRSQGLVLAAFAAVLAGGAVLVATQMAPPGRRGSRPTPASPGSPGSGSSAPAPAATEPAPERSALVRLDVRAEGGRPVASVRLLARGEGTPTDLAVGEGMQVAATYVGGFVRAEGAAWAQIPAPGADGVAPVAGARVRGLSPEGPCGGEATAAPDGAFRWAGRMTERLSLVASAPGYADAAVEPPLPDPRLPLETSAEIRLSARRPALGVDL